MQVKSEEPALGTIPAWTLVSSSFGLVIPAAVKLRLRYVASVEVLLSAGVASAGVAACAEPASATINASVANAARMTAVDQEACIAKRYPTTITPALQ